MFESLFDIPLWFAGTVIIGVLCAFSVAGLLLVRGRVLPRLRVETGDSEFTGSMLQSVMVFYGLAAALIAVTVFQTHSDTSKVVSGEATALNALYRDVTSYPEPRSEQSYRANSAITPGTSSTKPGRCSDEEKFRAVVSST
jgi:hypothetical protein